MVHMLEKAILIFSSNLNSGRSYHITTVRKSCSGDRKIQFEIFEVTRTIYSNRGRSLQILKHNTLIKLAIGTNNWGV